MGSIGGYLVGFGTLSAVLSFFNSEFVLLSWIGIWGDGVAWFIRGAIILVGGLLLMADGRRSHPAQPQHENVVR